LESTSAELATAIKLHQSGQLRAAEAMYQRMLSKSPNQADPWHLLGVIASQEGRLQVAIDHISRALQLSGDQAVPLFNLGNVLRNQGNLPAAIAKYRRTIELESRWLPPRVALAETLEAQRDLSAAADAFRAAIILAPRDARLRGGFGRVLRSLGQMDEAANQYALAAKIAPHDAAAQNDLGTIHDEVGKLDLAMLCFERAIQFQPDCLEAHLNLASCHNRRRAFDRAEQHYIHALRIKPESTDVRNALGNACLMQGKIEESRKHFRAGLMSQPENWLWRLRMDLLAPEVFDSRQAIDQYRRQLIERLREYQGVKLALPLEELTTSSCKPPVGLAYQGQNDLEIKRLFANIFADQLPQKPLPPRHGVPRLGLVVAQGSEGVFLRGMAGVINRLTAGRFELCIFTAAAAREKVRQAVKNPLVELVALPKSLLAAVDVVRANACDLLYYWEVGIDCLTYFLPMFRPARVQCSSWGWPVTSGMAAIDFFVSSKLLEPPGAQAHYGERLIQLDSLPNYYPAAVPFVPPFDRARLGIAPQTPLYFCGQNPRKIHPDFDQLVAEILQRDRNGVLVLIEASQPHVTRALQARFRAAMPDCFERIRFAPRMRSGDYLSLMAAADVALDTVHYGGGANTTYDAFTMGTPVVTMPTEFHRGRYAYAAYRAMDTSDCIASSANEYVELAIRLANDRAARAAAAQLIKDNSSKIFDRVDSVRELESWFETAALEGRRS